MNDRTTHLDDIVPILAASARHREAEEQRFAHLWRLTPEQRIAAMWAGRLSLAECLAWSRRAPHEVPLIGREFAYIVMRTPEWLGD